MPYSKGLLRLQRGEETDSHDKCLPVPSNSSIDLHDQSLPAEQRSAGSAANAGTGSPQHLCVELFKIMAAVDMVHVPYRGARPAFTDLLGGQVQVYFSEMSAIEYIRSDKLRALAVTTATRLEVLPDIPTVAEFVPGIEASGFLGTMPPTPSSCGEILRT